MVSREWLHPCLKRGFCDMLRILPEQPHKDKKGTEERYCTEKESTSHLQLSVIVSVAERMSNGERKLLKF